MEAVPCIAGQDTDPVTFLEVREADHALGVAFCAHVVLVCSLLQAGSCSLFVRLCINRVLELDKTVHSFLCSFLFQGFQVRLIKAVTHVCLAL